MQKKTAVKLEETKEVVAATAVEKATEVKEKAKTAVKKASSKKAAKEPLKPEVFIQFQGQEAVVDEAIRKATDEYVAAGHRASSIKSLQVYLKPEENAAYYVINQKAAGRVDLF